jgi:glycosyltransferase involved in cell wall biosynthesis
MAAAGLKLKQMRPPPLVSVIIPYFHQAHFLRAAIESVLQQTYRHFELVVVDDGSTDRASEVAARYPGIKLIRQSNQGVAAARNTGFRASAGEFLVFLDADDLLLPAALKTGVDALRAHREAAFVYGYGRFIDAHGNPLPSPRQARVTRNHYQRLLKINYIWSVGATMFRRAHVDGFRLGIEGCDDWDLYLRITKNNPVHCHHQTIYLYRRHGLNLSGQGELMVRAALTLFRDQLEVVRGDRKLENLCRKQIHLNERWLAGHRDNRGELLNRITQKIQVRTRARALARIFKR